ncbi:major histocompatibility complex class I-related gene protein-like [Lampris incognitus]|uniref:major histocompatibility complex class I-related gene protein-like n=1 Tax=Lampris incognitus TaxID=2546036 RepID=UPI0024B616CF|nr:major histocompatibility complex class I-related gene protein-like [Lampris incognitus]
MKVVILLLVFCPLASSVTHSLKYFLTASSHVQNFPEFVIFGMVDGLQMVHYDSNTQRAVPKQDWMDQVATGDPQYWETETGNMMSHQQWYKTNIETVKQRFNQTGGVHIFQRMSGCEWDDETGDINGYHQYAYDGEDFIALDLKTETWVTPTSQALITKLSWDLDKADLAYRKNYYTHVCVDWLKKYLQYASNSLQRTAPPSVSLLQRSPSSPVTCHATGFYPDRIVMFWRREEEEVHEEVEHGELLPNHDGTFQRSVQLLVDLSSMKSEEWQKYHCVVQLSGMKDDIIIKLDPSQIKTNWKDPAANMPIIIGVLVAVIIIMAAIGVAWYMKKKAKRPPPSPDSGSELSHQLNPDASH